jgi:2-(1,2-epoxy-1,2-dihydrophenyl)acetyl-CoA isomerase
MLIDIEQRGAVGIIRLNDPATLNAVSVKMIEELTEAVERASATSRALVIGSHGRGFSSGANLGDVAKLGDLSKVDAGAFLESHGNPLMQRLSALDIPWVSAVRGVAAGIGCSLALAADLIVAGDSAYFLQAFVNVGLVPDGGANWLLTQAIGRVRAMEMVLLGEPVKAVQALEWGMINRVVPDDEVESAAIVLASKLASGPTRAIGLTRKLGWAAAQSGWEETLHAERGAQGTAGRCADFREGVQAFLEKRPASFTGA